MKNFKGHISKHSLNLKQYLSRYKYQNYDIRQKLKNLFIKREKLTITKHSSILVSFITFFHNSKNIFSFNKFM